MHMANTDFPEFLAGQTADLIKQADAKATSTLYVLGISTAALMARLTAVKSSGAMTPQWTMFFAIAIVMIILAFKSIIAVIYPRLGKPAKNDLTYFESVASMTKESHAEQGIAMTDAEISRALHGNAWSLAQVAHRKYHALRIALAMTGISIASTILILLLA